MASRKGCRAAAVDVGCLKIAPVVHVYLIDETSSSNFLFAADATLFALLRVLNQMVLFEEESGTITADEQETERAERQLGVLTVKQFCRLDTADTRANSHLGLLVGS